MVTHENRTLVKDMDIDYNPTWSVKDWILFGTIYGDLYKIRSNGQELTKLAGGAKGYFPCWSPKGDKFFCNRYLDSPVIADENGNIIKECKEALGGSYWLDDENIYWVSCYREPKGIGIYNLYKDTFIKKYDLPDPNMKGAVRINDHEILWLKDSVFLTKTDLETHMSVTIRQICNNRLDRYNGFFLAPDGKSFITEIWKHSFYNTDTVRQNIFLYKMDLDGKLEKLDIKP